jgi:hypothetical protein
MSERKNGTVPWQQHPWMQALRPLSPDEEAARWKSFDSLTLSRTGDNNFKAEIKFRDDTGKLETHNFKGTRQQIRKDINASDHPPWHSCRRQLFRAKRLCKCMRELTLIRLNYIAIR